MNSNFLYAATVAISLISSLAMADEAPATRAQVNAELRQAIVYGTLQHSDYSADSYRQPGAAVSAKTRTQVAVELAQAKTARATLIKPKRPGHCRRHRGSIQRYRPEDNSRP